MRSLVVVEETCMISHKDFSSLQSHNFWNTVSWKCSLKDLIECQSFSNRKININLKYSVLMLRPCTVHVSRETWYREVNRALHTLLGWSSTEVTNKMRLVTFQKKKKARRTQRKTQLAPQAKTVRVQSTTLNLVCTRSPPHVTDRDKMRT